MKEKGTLLVVGSLLALSLATVTTDTEFHR